MSDYFFYDLNKKMADLASKQQLTEDAATAPAKSASSPLRTQLNERDLGKHNNATTGFAALAKKTGGGEKGARIAGAQLAKMRAKGQVKESKKECPPMSHIKKMCQDGKSLAEICKMHPDCDQTELKQMVADCKKKLSEGSKPDFLDLDKDGNRKEPMKSAARGAKKDMDESALQAYLGDKKYGEKGMDALRAAGREHASKTKMQNIRAKFSNKEKDVAEGLDKQALQKELIIINKLIKVMKNSWQQQHLLQKKQELLKQLKQGVAEAGAPNAMAPMNPDGATAPPAKGPDGQYPVVTSGPNKGKRWSPNTPGPTNPSMKEGGIPMTPKQQKFAKLAPPVDKITFADKIVGAKKEVDEVLGDVAAKAMKKAVASNWANLGSEYQDRPMKSGERRRTHTGGEIEQTAPGVTRHHAGKSYSGSAHDDSADLGSTGSVGRRKVGAGQGTKIGAKINTGKSKLMTREGDMDPADQGEYDQEGSMAKDDIKTVVRHAQALEKILGDNDNLPEWVQAKLAKIEGMMTAVDDYMQNQQGDDEGSDDMEMDEESTNKRDSRAEKAGKKVAKDIEYDEKKKDGIHGKRRGSEDSRAERAGKKVTKDIEYDEKKKDKKKDDKKEVDETTTSGSVATGSAAPKSGGSMSYGKGIYDSLDRQVEKMIAESMSINMSMNNDAHGGPSNTLTVTATDEDALQLAMLLKSAGIGSQEHGDMSAIHDMDDDMSAIHAMDHDHGDEPCPACGSSDCECDEVQEAYGDTDATENKPDWPTDQEGTNNAMMYSGGLDGPKSTGQTTVPVIGGQHDRMGYNGDHELRRMMEIAGFAR